MDFPSFPVDVIVTPSPPYPISVSYSILGLPPGGSQLRGEDQDIFNWEKALREFIIDSTGQRYIRTNKIRMWFLEKEIDSRYVHITHFNSFKKKERERQLSSQSPSPIPVVFQMDFPSFPVDVNPPYSMNLCVVTNGNQQRNESVNDPVLGGLYHGLERIERKRSE